MGMSNKELKEKINYDFVICTDDSNTTELDAFSIYEIDQASINPSTNSLSFKLVGKSEKFYDVSRFKTFAFSPN
jgi:hypothetical protein